MKKDIFEFNHIDNLLIEDEIKTILTSTNTTTKNFGVLRKLKNILKFLMKVLIYLEFY